MLASSVVKNSIAVEDLVVVDLAPAVDLAVVEDLAELEDFIVTKGLETIPMKCHAVYPTY